MGSKVIRNITKVFKSASGVLFGRVTSGTGRGEELTATQVRSLLSVSTAAEVAAAYQPIGSYAAASHTHTASQVTDFSEATDDRVSSLLVAGTNITITYNDAANTLTIAASGGGLSGTGSVDNAALRADGTGGATLQSSAWIINDNLTASPNNTVNHACLEATGGTTNVSVSVKPKGTGSFTLAAPDGTATGGNVRGANAVDLQTYRTASTQVPSGTYSACIGAASTNSGVASVAAGWAHNITADYCFAAGKSMNLSAANSLGLGESHTCSASYTTAIGGTGHNVSATRGTAIGGYQCTVSAADGFAFGNLCLSSAVGAWASGIYAVASRYGMVARAAGAFAASGDVQVVEFQSRNKTTSAVATELFLDGSSTRLSIPSGKMLSALVRITGIKSDGSEIIKFLRDVTIKNVGGTTSLEAAVVTIGTDINVSAATLDLSADNTNDALKIAVTPPAGTWRWMAVVECACEIAYGA